MTYEKACVEDARMIARAMLDKTGEATMSQDFETYAECFKIPQTMETYAGKITIATLADLRDVFNAVVRQFDAMDVTHFERVILAAEFKGPDMVVVAHETRLMRGNYLLREPYPAYGTCEKIDGRWMITDSMYAINDINSVYSNVADTNNHVPDT